MKLPPHETSSPITGHSRTNWAERTAQGRPYHYRSWTAPRSTVVSATLIVTTQWHDDDQEAQGVIAVAAEPAAPAEKPPQPAKGPGRARRQRMDRRRQRWKRGEQRQGQVKRRGRRWSAGSPVGEPRIEGMTQPGTDVHRGRRHSSRCRDLRSCRTPDAVRIAGLPQDTAARSSAPAKVSGGGHK